MIPNHDFLALTLLYPEKLTPFEFSFAGGRAFIEETGVLRLEPECSSSISLVLSVGIHGNETGPIELVNGLVADILEGRLSLGIRLLVLIGNPVAANLGERFCEVNLNRLFRGAWQNHEGFESLRAQCLEKAVSDFFEPVPEGSAHTRLHYDLHTAIRGSAYEMFAVYPYVEEAVYNQEQLAFLAASGINAVLLSHQATTTFSYYSYLVHGAHAFTIELGKVYSFGNNDLARFSALKTSLVSLLEEGQFAATVVSQMQIFKVVDALIKDHENYELNIASDVKNFTQFTQNYLLTHSAKSDYRIAQTGDAIVFPNVEVPIGQRAGLVVRPVSIADLQLN
ncbi:succinylglutamate desuccinylase [Marinomonas transparens]|uniref:succinylglutamate desuccinylase n=1 Tax=Marinomonas transparens TaxID=2795388 RepID=UPI002D7FA5B0|nr:succinylglutamate desuccinylase [Marinomonas transparens]